VARSYVPDRGDIVQAGHRPALVISPRAYNARVGLALFCPVTAQVKGYPFEVVLPTGLEAQGAILSDQIKSLDWRERKAKRVCTVPTEILEQTVELILALVDPKETR